ncbi:tripartite tricarboxylate transporter permease [bacterium]|nr:tripartite tricarboxylate transporter permease [bacterium]
MFEHLAAGFMLIIQWPSLLAIVIGVNIGIIMGAIPGLTGAMAIALIIPMTFTMSPSVAIPMLLGIYKGGIFGGSIPAILLNTPGSPASAATAIDGYALTKQGKGMKALKTALYGSFIGDTFSDLCLLFVAAPLASLALKCGPSEYASIIIFSLTIIAAVSGASLTKGMIAATLGMVFAMVGLDPILGTPRLTFGSASMSGGINLLPMLIGLLAMSEVFGQMARLASNSKLEQTIAYESLSGKENKLTWREMKPCIKPVLRASVIGTLIGALPGIGPSTAAFLGYSEAKRTSKHPEKFGKGALEGIASAEAGNNAVCGANLIPLLSLGIPGDIVAAVLVGAFMIQGMRLGPLLIKEQPDVVYSILLGLIICNLAYRFFGTFFIRFAVKTVKTPKVILLPIVSALCIAGAYGVRGGVFDVKVMFVFGVLGFIFSKYGFSLPAMLIAFILEPMLENSFRQAMILHDWNLTVFITRPVSAVFLGLTVLSIISTVRRARKMKKG